MEQFLLQNGQKLGSDLILVKELGYAYQADRSRSVAYDEAYFDKYRNYEGSPVAVELNKFRTSITQKYCKNTILDVGIGSGEFIKSSKLNAYGSDINPVAIQWLKDREKYIDLADGIPDWIDGICCWDVLEHLPSPTEFLSKLKVGQWLFVSIPIFDDLTTIHDSKHHRPDEHYWYFTAWGLVRYVEKQGFRVFETTWAETRAGREGIGSFVFHKRFDPALGTAR